jgi:predicted butyrate kinase (DUF1464 family)
VTFSGVRGIGLDYGTGGIKCLRLAPDGRREALAFSGPDANNAATAWLLAASAGDPDATIVLPSGFGVPLRPVQALGEQDLFEMTCRREDPAGSGLGAFLAPLRATRLPAYLIPAVKGLPTVPRHRKANRIDLGTADKLCAAALVIWRLAGGEGSRLPAVDALVLELGAGFKAWVVVAGGRIVEGIGGTAGTPGPRGRGALDGEVAYLAPPCSKADIYGGGTADLDAAFGGGLGEAALWEGVEREAAMLTRFFGIERIVASGRRRAEAIARLAARGYRVESLAADPDLARLDRGADGVEAALGAALLADGLAGGRAAPLVAHLGLRDATDRVLDYLWMGTTSCP